MRYYLSKELSTSYTEAVKRVTEELSREGFGILTEIDVKQTLKKKLDADFRPYVILGACNPPLAHRALESEDKIGLMLPCNVIVQEHAPGRVEVAAIDPEVAMQSVDNAQLAEIAGEVRSKLAAVIERL